MGLKERYEAVMERIANACQRCGRSPEEVTLIAVTKYLDVEGTRQVLELGINDIGENRVQQALPKWEALRGQGTWHFIGHLQRNKVKEVVGRFHVIHSLDRLSLAEEIEKRAKTLGQAVPCLIQVNISGEASKFGLEPKNLLDFAERLSIMEYIRAVGLMTMAPKGIDSDGARRLFHQLYQWRERLQALKLPRVTVEHLSMGMSQDFEEAIEEGATMVRIGSVLVGAEEA